MRLNHTLLAALGAAGLLLGLGNPAQAFPVNPQTCGIFSADPATNCSFISGDAADSEADINTLYPRVAPDVWVYIDKDEEAKPGSPQPPPASPWGENDFFLTDELGNPINWDDEIEEEFRVGRFYISDDLLAAYDELVLVLKGGNNDPGWAAFLLDLKNLAAGGPGYQYGVWSFASNSISHATLYGIEGDGNRVPEPGSLALLGLGLAGLGIARRRKAG